jgi:predicted TIM-barrel fold metal-dependent hydrolase
VKNSIPIFDSLTHPDEKANLNRRNSSDILGLKKLISEMYMNNVSKAFFVWNKILNFNDQKEYLNNIKPFRDRIIPVTLFHPVDQNDTTSIGSRLKSKKAMGFSGIKLHPRISGFNLNEPDLVRIVKEANDLHLSVQLCTYFYNNANLPQANSFEMLSDFVFQLDGSKVILLHGGGVRLLETIEIARAFNNILLDLSFTICKYQGSSLDLDIQYAFTQFDQRICIGSDYPEFNLSELRERFEHFSLGLPIEKVENIAFKNISQFLQQ